MSLCELYYSVDYLILINTASDTVCEDFCLHKDHVYYVTEVLDFLHWISLSIRFGELPLFSQTPDPPHDMSLII